jgi:hypothetical protein
MGPVKKKPGSLEKQAEIANDVQNGPKKEFQDFSPAGTILY